MVWKVFQAAFRRYGYLMLPMTLPSRRPPIPVSKLFSNVIMNYYWADRYGVTQICIEQYA